MRKEFKKILELEDDLEVVGEAMNGPPSRHQGQKASSRIGADGHYHAAFEWAKSHLPDSHGRGGSQKSTSIQVTLGIL